MTLAGAVLFRPFTTGDVTLRNRVVIPPMCQYAADANGHARDWHLVHLGSFAAGGAGLIMVEATSVLEDARISAKDLGLWRDSQIAPLARIVDFAHEQGAAIGLQLAHAGRRAFSGDRGHGPPRLFAPSALPAGRGWRVPEAMTETQIEEAVDAFRAAAGRAAGAGFDVLELHGAHGYLLHSFLSPLSNRRADSYGGAAERRLAFALRLAAAVRDIWPRPRPLWLRLSCVDGAEGGLTLDDSIEIVRQLAPLVDLVDCSSGGIVDGAYLRERPGFQLGFARAIRQAVEVPTCAVGRLRSALQCERALSRGDADLVAIGRAALEDPYWALRAGRRLGAMLPYDARSSGRSRWAVGRDRVAGFLRRQLAGR